MSRAASHPGFRRLCARADVTLAEVAHICGFVPTHLSNWLAGRVSANSARRIEERVGQFFFGRQRDAATRLRRALARKPIRGERS